MITWVLLVLTAGLALGYNIIATRSSVGSPLLLNYWLFATLLVASLVITRLVSFVLVKVWFPRFTGKASTQLLRLSVEFVTFGTLFILNANLILGAKLSTLLTTSAVITVVLGFALQATLGNLFEGLSVQIHQPFAIGDGLEFGDYYGTVESLTWRAIALRQNDNTLLIVPNNVLAQSAVVVYAEDQPYQASCTFFAPVDVPPNQIRELLEPALARLEIAHSMRLPEVFMEEYTPSGSAIRYQAKLFVPYKYRLDYCRSVMMERIWYSLARAGISIPTAIESTISNYKIPLIYSRDTITNTAESVVKILGQCQIFRGVSEASLELIATQSKRQIFAANEMLERQGNATYAMYVVLRGLVVVPLPHEIRQDDVQSQHYIWSASVLDQIRQQYAVYMGPAAKVLIEQAATKTSDPYHLYDMLAEEIPNEAERMIFKGLRPAFPSKEIFAGGYFGQFQLFANHNPDESTPLARQESELLEISQGVINAVIQQDAIFLDLVATNLAQAHGLGSIEMLALQKAIRARYKLRS